VTGQGMIARQCAWCGHPAVCELEIAPGQYRMLGRVDPIIGDRSACQQLLHAAIIAAACDQHKQITTGRSPAVGVPCQCRARDVEQLGLFSVHGGTGR
jgi:hypothetical protein